MRNRLAWVLGGVAIAGAVLYRAVTPKRPPTEPELAPDPRAADLRRKLAESRTLVAEREEFEGAETSVDEAEPAPPDVKDRRHRVHEEGRAAARRMRRPPAGD